MLAVALVIGLAFVPLSPAATTLTPDQQLVAGLETASAASRAALRDLAQPTAKRVASASGDLRRALDALAAANKVAPQAVGALNTRSVRTALRRAGSLGRRAATDIAKGRYRAARLKIETALALKSEALADFGVPLQKEFAAFAVTRDLRDVPGFATYSGLSATVGARISEIVIGAADRTTANAGEQANDTVSASAPLPITRLSRYFLSDPIGRWTTGWCTLSEGLVTCSFSQLMLADRIFTVAFAPKLPRGTKLLVKFRSDSGRRSYAVMALR
jgi:hypothetical protein